MKNFVFLTIMCIFAVTKAFAQTQTENYVMAETMLDASGNKKITSVQYYDELGRPSLAVQNGINSSSSVSNYTLQEYDGCGRESKSWLPIAGSGLGYNPNITSSASDSKAYSQTTYDALGRPVFVSTPGSDMNGKGKTIEYTTNVANSVKRYKISGANVLSQDGYYPACSLTGEKTTDEDGHTIEVFKNLLGNVVLERRASSGKYDTYYVYNDLQQLAFVLQPMYQQTPNANLYSFQYTYDSKGRMATKRLPGCGTCYYSYDNADRMISSKDGNGVIHFYLYDGLGRQVIQGTCSNMLTNDQPYMNLDFALNSSAFLGTGYLLPNGYQLNNTELEIASYYDSYSFLNSAIVADSSTLNALKKADTVVCAASFPTGNITMASDGTRLFSAYYYDLKGNVTQQYETMLDGVVMKTETTYSFTDKPTERTSTLISGGKEYPVTETFEYDQYSNKLKSDYMYNYYYDNLGRVNAKYSDNYMEVQYRYDVRGWMTDLINRSYLDEVFSEHLVYNDTYFNGNINRIKYHTYNDDTGMPNDFTYEFTYDKQNRLTDAYYDNDYDNSDYSEYISYNANGSPVTLERYGLNNLGRYGCIDYLSYAYNGNRLTSISDLTKTSLTYSNSFEFRDKSNTGSEYTYDNNGNMTRDLNSKIDFIEYDKLDHPIRIQFMDGSNIQYVYAADGRKLKVAHQTAVDNLTVSANRKLDLSETQLKTTLLPAVDNIIVASDRKLDLSESQLKSQTVQYYMGNFVLTNGILDRYYFGSDGYAKFTNGKPVYSSRTKGYTYSTVNSSDVLLNPEYRVTQNVYPFYFVKDHLGSNRMVADNPSTMVSYYPYGGIYYDDFRFYQADDNHLYNGKEMDRMYGLDWLDYGARMDNPAIGLWTQMDPLAEKYYHLNPYVYCGGNPVNYVDPTGMEPDTLDAAMMSALAYGLNTDYISALKDKGWNEYSPGSSSSSTGFKSKMFRREVGEDKNGNTKYEYCVAFAGTDIDDGAIELAKDMANDVLNFIGSPSPQCVEGIYKGKSVSSGIAKKSELTFVGHSLGGFLATIASKFTGRDAIVFNPASISGIVKLAAEISSIFNGGKITQYRSYGDYVNAVQDLTGRPSSGNVKWVKTEHFISHRIDEIIKSFLRNKR